MAPKAAGKVRRGVSGNEDAGEAEGCAREAVGGICVVVEGGRTVCGDSEGCERRRTFRERECGPESVEERVRVWEEVVVVVAMGGDL